MKRIFNTLELFFALLGVALTVIIAISTIFNVVLEPSEEDDDDYDCFIDPEIDAEFDVDDGK